MAMEQGDIALFNRIKQDDRLALNTAFATYYQKLCRFATTCSLTHEQAEEVVADVFFTLWKNRERLDIYSSFKAYLYTCVKHAAMALLETVPDEVAYTDLHEETDTLNPELILNYQELQLHLDKAVSHLPPRCRQIFVMNRLDGLKYREISAILGLSERTVENQLVKALSSVRTALSKYEEDNHRVHHNTITLS